MEQLLFCDAKTAGCYAQKTLLVLDTFMLRQVPTILYSKACFFNVEPVDLNLRDQEYTLQETWLNSGQLIFKYVFFLNYSNLNAY